MIGLALENITAGSLREVTLLAQSVWEAAVLVAALSRAAREATRRHPLPLRPVRDVLASHGVGEAVAV